MKLKIKLDIKPILNYLAIILLTSLAITTVLVALPLTEHISERTSFDLLTKDKYYWSSEYILTLQTTQKKDVEVTRNILFKRLERFGVEKISIRNIGEDKEENSIIRVVVNTTQDPDLIRELLTNRFEVKIVTKKEDVDFFDPEDEYAYLFAENYDPTEWDSNDFRNVYVTELKNANKTYSNFAIFKPWPNKQGAFSDFLDSYRGEYIGVNVDGFVTPYLVPFEEQNVFAVPLNSDEDSHVKAMSILYNSGTIPTDITLESEEQLDPQIIQLDHIRVSIGLLISFILVYAYILLLKKADNETLKKSFLATIMTISIYLTVLKLFSIPIDTFLLPIIGILTALLIKIISTNRDSVVYIEVGLITVLMITMFLSYGYMNILATHLIPLVILSKLCLVVSGWYLDKVRRI
jgi:preprotein translocase subunit SecD